MHKSTIRNSRQLADAGLVPESKIDEISQVAERYSVAITPIIADLIDTTDSKDPIAKQFVPHSEELVTSYHELKDPIGDMSHSPVKGVVHRYPDRALLTPTHTCPVYCRYCFRREFVGTNQDGSLSSSELDDCFDYFRDHPEIWEVILSGGDPLVLSDRRLAAIFENMSTIAHVRIVRIHSRVPTVAPERVTPDLIRTLQSSQQTLFLLLHINHQDELTPAARAACARLVDAGIPLLSQTVLLRGVNDDSNELAALMRLLVENRIKPYYLHHCDIAPGTERFRTSISTGREIMRELRGNVSGLCQPTYVLDIPGGAGKSPIGPNYVAKVDGAESEAPEYVVEDYQGERHDYACIAHRSDASSSKS